jgi:hypothetical protein
VDRYGILEIVEKVKTKQKVGHALTALLGAAGCLADDAHVVFSASVSVCGFTWD